MRKFSFYFLFVTLSFYYHVGRAQCTLPSSKTTYTVCGGSSVALTSSGGITYSWSPANEVSDPNSSITNVSPMAPSIYVVTKTDLGGCVGKDTFIVNLESYVDAGNYITINAGDMANLSATALGTSSIVSYSWDPSWSLNNSMIRTPKAFPTVTTTYEVTATDINGCISRDTITVFVSMPLSINYNMLESDVAVYPNPFSDFTTFKITENKGSKYKLSILNSTGFKVQDYEFTTKEFTINSSLSSGVYFYLLTDEEGNTRSGKLMVE